MPAAADQLLCKRCCQSDQSITRQRAPCVENTSVTEGLSSASDMCCFRGKPGWLNFLCLVGQGKNGAPNCSAFQREVSRQLHQWTKLHFTLTIHEERLDATTWSPLVVAEPHLSIYALRVWGALSISISNLFCEAGEYFCSCGPARRERAKQSTVQLMKNIQIKTLLYNYRRIRHPTQFWRFGASLSHGSAQEQRLYISRCKLKHLPMGRFRIYISCCVLLASCEFGGFWEIADLTQAWFLKIS